MMPSGLGNNILRDTVAQLSQGRREAMYQIALSDGDKRRAEEIALAPIPEDWSEHEQAVWRGRQALARQQTSR